MIVRRGDVVLAWYPFSTGAGGKRRPVLVVQNDTDNGRISHTIVAQITSNLDRAGMPTHLLIELGSSAGIQSGLLHDSVVSGNNLATLGEELIHRKIGRFPPDIMRRVDDCLKAALALS